VGCLPRELAVAGRVVVGPDLARAFDHHRGRACRASLPPHRRACCLGLAAGSIRGRRV